MLDDLAADREPEPGPLRLRGQRVADLAELLEDRAPGPCGAIPGPLSRTCDPDLAGQRAERDRDPAARVRAELRRVGEQVDRTCTRRSRSAKTGGTSAGRSTSSVAPLSANSPLVAATACSITSRGSTSRVCHSARPDSILARSSTWLMSRVSRSVLVNDDREVLARLASVELRVVVEDLGERADRGERRAQLVRDRARRSRPSAGRAPAAARSRSGARRTRWRARATSARARRL